MTKSVTDRLDALRDELRFLDPRIPGVRSRIERIKRQIAMLTEGNEAEGCEHENERASF